MNATTNSHVACLTLKRITDPASPDRSVPFFSGWEAAVRHVADHLLTAPECHAWALVAPEIRQIVEPTDGDARWHYSRNAWESQGASAQGLYDAYCQACSRDARDAAGLGWVKTRGRVTVALGTSGILLVVEAAVRTAFLPGQGDQQATAASAPPSHENPLPRERGMRSGRPGRLDEQQSRKDDEAQKKREARWTAEERLYHRVFKPAAQFVKRSQNTECDMFGQTNGSDYGLVKDQIPYLSQLKFDDWVVLRRYVGRSHEP